MEPIRSLFKYRGLLWQFLLRNVKARHRGSVLGALWLILNPLLMLGLYVFAFGVVFGGRFTDSPNESTLDFALGIFLGLNVLGLVSGIIGASPGLIVGQPNFVKKVVFPLEVLPAAMTGALAYDLLIGLGLSLTGIAILGPGLTPNAFYVPIIVCPVFLMAFGLSWFFSALGVFVRDIGHLGTFLGLALLIRAVFFIRRKRLRQRPRGYGSFAMESTSSGYRFLAKLRLGRELDWWKVGYAWVFGIVVFVCGAWFFNRLRPAFADVL